VQNSASGVTSKQTTTTNRASTVWVDAQKRAVLQNSFQGGPSHAASLRVPTNTPRGPRGPRGQQVPTLVVPTPSIPTSGLANMALGSAVSYNPSMAPAATLAPGQIARSRAPTMASQGTQATYRGVIRNQNCILLGQTKANFKKGDIICTPYHQPNLVPNPDPNDFRLTRTCEGPVYSKRRMLVVLMIYEQTMYCLPLYTWSGRGLGSRPAWLKKEYVAMKNAQHKKLYPGEPFVNDGVHDEIEVICRHPVKVQTTIQLTGGVKVDCCGDVNTVGRLTQTGYKRLMALWQKVNEDAKNAPW